MSLKGLKSPADAPGITQATPETVAKVVRFRRKSRNGAVRLRISPNNRLDRLMTLEITGPLVDELDWPSGTPVRLEPFNKPHGQYFRVSGDPMSNRYIRSINRGEGRRLSFANIPPWIVDGVNHSALSPNAWVWRKMLMVEVPKTMVKEAA